MKQIFTYLLIIAFTIAGNAQDVGESAPDFTLKTLTNENYKLSENRGSVILVFLVGYGCPLCIASAPTVKSQIMDEYISNSNFQSLIIDTWNGSTSAFKNFQNTTGLPGVYLQKGGDVATDWSTTYDRLVVIDSEGVMTFKGKSAASNDVGAAKQAVEEALNSIVTSVGNLKQDNGFWVEQNYPNPFSEKTTIDFHLPKAATVSLKILDISGKEIRRIANRQFPEGRNSLEIHKKELNVGIYFYRLEFGEQSVNGKMIVN